MDFAPYIFERDSLCNTRFCLEKAKKLRIAYFGGSVTAGYGAQDFDVHGSAVDKSSWRAKMTAWLKERYPEADIESIYAAIGESGTYLGTYRLYDHVIAKDPDLAFVEFAINDTYGGFDRERAAYQFETIVRELRTAKPFCDIIVLISGDRNVFERYDGFFPTAQGHADIAKAYGLPLVYMGRALYDHIKQEDIPWQTHYVDGVHPNNAGYAFYFDVIKTYMQKALADASVLCEPRAHTVPKSIVSEHLLDGDRKLVYASHTMLRESPGWYYSDKNVNTTLSKTGSVAAAIRRGMPSFSYTFSGTEFAVFTNLYGDRKYEYSVDRGEWKEAIFSTHNPTTVVTGLASGTHRIAIHPLPSEEENAENEMYIAAVMFRDETKQTVRE